MVFIYVLIAAASLDDGVRALEGLRVEEAAQLLERARSEGPYDLERHKLLYEKLGTAYAYLDQTEKAQAAFTQLLLLDRSHKLSPGSSPKIVEPFEWARYRVSSQPETTIDIQWPDIVPRETQTLPLRLTVGADPRNLIKTLGVTLIDPRGPAGTITAKASSVGMPTSIEIHLSAQPQDADTLRLSYYLRGLDARGNEIFGVGSAAAPQTIRLPYEQPVQESSWYGSWWFWTLVGGAAIAGGTAAAVVLSRDPPESQPLSFRLP